MAVAVPSREEGAVVPSAVTAAEAAVLGADDHLTAMTPADHRGEQRARS